MRKLLLGIIGAAFLSFVGLQASHSHAKEASAKSCQVCVLGSQSARHAPAGSPRIQNTEIQAALPEAARVPLASAARLAASARAPPVA